MIQGFSGGLLNRQLIYNLDLPSFQRDFASLKTLDHGTGPAINFTRASNATYFDANGTLQTAANNEPRFDHDPATGASSGLLIEEARTNSIRNSQGGGSTNGVIGSGGVLPTNWGNGSGLTTNGLSLEVVGTGTENGLAYLDFKVSGTPTASAAGSFRWENATNQIVALNGQSWTLSNYIKLQSGSLANAGVSMAIQGYDSTNNFISGQQTSINITPTSSALNTQRRSVSHTHSSASTAFTFSFIAIAYTSGNPIDLTLRIAAPQLEQGAFATSYIPTTTAAATRSSDSAVVTPISSFYNQAEGTFVAEATYFGKVPAVFSRIFSIGNTTAGDPDRWFWGFNDANTNHLIQHFTAGVFDFGISFATSAGTVYKVASAIALNNARAAQNGSLLGSDDTSVGAPSNKTHMVIGGSPSGAAGAALHFRKIAYYPRRLSNALLEQLTT